MKTSLALPVATRGARRVRAREMNAIIAIAAREIVLAIKNPAMLAFTLLFPIIFVGILGSSLAQNLGGGLGYNYMQFVLIGMIVNTLYQTTIQGVVTLVEDRQNDFTQEMFVSPISRYSILLGKIVGASVVSLFQLVGLMAVALVLSIPLDGGDFLRLLLLAPIISLAGGALGLLFIGFVHDPRVAGVGSFLLVFPQMFISGALIPVKASTGLLGFLTHVVPMTYSIDLARNIFYLGKPAHDAVVLYSPLIDLAVTVAFFLAFTVIGTFFFTRSEHNR